MVTSATVVITVVVLEAEDSEVVAGAEDVEDLDSKRSTLGRI